jgi:hypothetical protein
MESILYIPKKVDYYDELRLTNFHGDFFLLVLTLDAFLLLSYI